MTLNRFGAFRRVVAAKTVGLLVGAASQFLSVIILSHFHQRLIGLDAGRTTIVVAALAGKVQAEIGQRSGAILWIYCRISSLL